MLSVVRPMYGAISGYITVERGPRPLMIVEWFTLAVLMGAIATLGRISPLWACGAVGIVFTMRSLLGMYVARSSSGISIATFLAHLTRPLLACGPMVAAVFAVRFGLRQAGIQSPIFHLAAEVAAGGLVFVGAAFLIAPGPAGEVLSLIRSRSRAPRGSGVPAIAEPAAQGSGGQPTE
jgi:PST family polysaccharide transporter